MNQNPKSATVAGLLGIFLGGVGAHSFYLGDKIKGIIHACLAGVAFLILLIAGVILPSTMSLWSLMTAAGTLQVFCILGYLIAAGNGIWALVEAIIILVQGDTGLAQRGIVTLTAVPATAETAKGKGGKAAAKTTAAATPTPVAVQPKAPRQPMDPAKKKKLILGLSIGGGALRLIIVAIVVISLLSKVDYGATYRIARDLDEKIEEFYYDSACEDAQYYSDSEYTDNDEYADYVDGCKAITVEMNDLINQLSSSSAIQKDSDLKSAFDEFVAEYRTVVPEQATLEAGLGAMQAWHSFIVAFDELDTSEATEADVQEACNHLINSGNETLATFGQNVYQYIWDYISAYRTWYDSDGYYNDAYDAYQDAYDALEAYADDNTPEIEEIVGFDLEATGDVYGAYGDLYDEIVEKYEENYDGSVKCDEYRGSVVCD